MIMPSNQLLSQHCAKSRIMTESQRSVGESITRMGYLFFTNKLVLPGINLRLFPLVIGPTGVGKSSLVEQVSHELHAEYMKVTRGDWLVQGCRSGRPTVFQILDQVTTFGRVALHIDELDKFQIDFSSQEWSASLASDLWNILDGKFPVAEYLRETEFPDRVKPSEAIVRSWIKKRLWIIGSGTWQSVFKQCRSGSTVGFSADITTHKVTGETIAHSELISPELLHRYNSDIFFLSHPDLSETKRMLEEFGIQRLAAALGESIAPEDINWQHGGMRVLEAVATRLVLAQQQRDREKSGLSTHSL